MSLIKIVLSAVAIVSILVFLISVFLVLGKKKRQVARMTKTLNRIEKQEA
jgi:hypothetical protein